MTLKVSSIQEVTNNTNARWKLIKRATNSFVTGTVHGNGDNALLIIPDESAGQPQVGKWGCQCPQCESARYIIAPSALYEILKAANVRRYKRDWEELKKFLPLMTEQVRLSNLCDSNTDVGLMAMVSKAGPNGNDLSHGGLIIGINTFNKDGLSMVNGFVLRNGGIVTMDEMQSYLVPLGCISFEIPTDEHISKVLEQSMSFFKIQTVLDEEGITESKNTGNVPRVGNIYEFDINRKH